MGGAWSKTALYRQASRKEAFYRALRGNQELIDKLKGVGLDQKQLHELYRIFSTMDKGKIRMTHHLTIEGMIHKSIMAIATDRSGEINMMEFFNYIDLNRSRFSEKAFAVMDKDGSGEVDFLEFVLAVWNYCSFSKSSLVRFAFDLYDLDGSGEIERSEAAQCIREVWGSEWEHSTIAQKIMGKLESIMENSASGRLSVNLFQDFAIRHPMLLFPAFQLQTEIQQKILGERFWAQAAKRRGTLDPQDFHWGSIENMAKVSRQNSNKLLTAIEADLGEQIESQLRRKKVGKDNVSKLKRFSSTFSGSSSVSAGIAHMNAESGELSNEATTAITELKATVEPLKPTERTRKRSNLPKKANAHARARDGSRLVVEDMDK